MNIIYLIIFSLFFLTAVFVILQIILEKKLLKSFSRNFQNIIQHEQQAIDEFSIGLIQIGWMPLSGRKASILFSPNINCKIYKDVIVFKLRTIDNKSFERVVYKKDIEPSWDIFAGNIIKFKIDNIKLICKVYSRIKSFQH